MDLQLGAELSGREVDGLQSNHVSSSTELQDWKDDDDREDDEDTQSVFLSDPAADIVDGGSDSDGVFSPAQTSPRTGEMMVRLTTTSWIRPRLSSLKLSEPQLWLDHTSLHLASWVQ